MRISISKAQYDHERRFLGELATTCRILGHEVGISPEPIGDLHIQWGARPHRDSPTLYAELGWLPRWHYQVSHTGINHEHHRQGETLSMDDNHLDADRILTDARNMIGAPHGWGYLDIAAPVIEFVPERFVLAPLQMEQDTNMDSIAAHLRTNAAFINAATTEVSATLGDVPIVFKQHPHSQAGDQLTLKTWRKGDKVYPHRQGHVYQYLKHTGCVAVIARNSNVLVDALLWDVPAMAMGRGIWPDDMFLTTLRDIDLWSLGDDYRDAYVCWLADVQWTLAQARDPVKVAEAIEGAVR